MKLLILFTFALTQFSYASDTLEIKIQGENAGETVTLKVSATPLSSDSISFSKYKTVDEDQVLATSRFQILLRNSIITITKQNMSLYSVTDLKDGSLKRGAKVDAFKINTREPLYFFENLKIRNVSPIDNSVVNLTNGELLNTQNTTFYFEKAGYLASLFSIVEKDSSNTSLFFPIVQGERLNLDAGESARVAVRIDFNSQEEVRKIFITAFSDYIKSSFKNPKTVHPSGKQLNFFKYGSDGYKKGSSNYFELSENGNLISGHLSEGHIYYNGVKYARDPEYVPTYYYDGKYFVDYKNGKVGFVSGTLNQTTIGDSLKYLCEKFGISDPLDPLKDTGFHSFWYDTRGGIVERGVRYFDVSKKTYITPNTKIEVEFFSSIYCPRSIPLESL